MTLTDDSWHPGVYLPYPEFPPHYSTMPGFIRVVDTIAPTLGRRKRRIWTAARDRGFAQWLPAGINVRVKDILPYGPNRTTLAVVDLLEEEGFDGNGMACFEGCHPIVPGTEGAAWIHLAPKAFAETWASRVYTMFQYLVAHEFGHNLGFGHGGTGIMDQTPDHPHVNDEEIAAARAYWLTA